MRTALTTLRDKTDTFEKALNAISPYLLDLPFPEMECLIARGPGKLSPVRAAIRDVKTLCDKALFNHPAKHGTPAANDKVRCALVVMGAWKFVHSDYPGHNNEKVQEACEEYWLACGSKAGNDQSLWSRHITTARRDEKRLERMGDFLASRLGPE